MKISYKGMDIGYTVVDESPYGLAYGYYKMSDDLEKAVNKAYFERKLIISEEAAENFRNEVFTNSGKIFVTKAFFNIDLSHKEMFAVMLHECGHAFYGVGEELSDAIAAHHMGENVLVSALEKMYLYICGGNTSFGSDVTC